ncbi:MAG: hypothetical protein PUC29_04795 [Clostridia bacterium]|nr:hypothetical protein [Clostridia bacterium]
MKKTLSLLLVIAMLMSAIVIAIPAGAAATAEEIDYVDALYFEPGKQPTIDGFISTAEWGSASIRVEATDCATKDDTSPYNRFLFWRTGDITDYSTFAYDVWFRWSENYFYIGVKVEDPDGHSLKNGTTETWNGDAVQTRIDKEGANAATDGEDFWVSTEHPKPWSSSQVPDFLFGYVQIAGGFSEAWENTSNKGMTSFSKNPMGTALCVVAPAGSNYSTDTSKGITTYEIGVPWAYILTGDTTPDGNQITALTYTKYKPGRKGNPAGGIGRELGISLVVLDDGNNPDATWDAFMSWGSGICEASQKEGAKSATGSNAVTLSETSVTQTAGYTTYNCSSLLDASFSTKNIDAPNTFYNYLGGDLYKDTKVKYEDLTVLTYDTDPNGDLSVWGAPEYKGHVTNIGGTHGNVLDYRNFVGNDKTSAATDTQTYIDSRDGQNSFAVPTSFTFEFDICYTDTVVVADAYESALYNWFGGASGYAFMCGYFFNDRMFKIVNTNDESQVLAQFKYDLKKDNWYNWKFQFDNESCTARLWIDDLSTDADNANSPWGTMVFNTCWRYFYYSSKQHQDNGTLLIYRMMNTQCMYDNVKVYNFASLTNIDVPNESEGGNGGASIPQDVTGGGELQLEGVTKKDGKWYIPVKVKSEYLTATQLSFTLNFDKTKAAFKAIEGLNEGTYEVTEKDGQIVITIKDFAQVKAMKAGDKFFDIVLDATDANADQAALSLKLADSYTYTVVTGDSMVFIIIAAVVAVLGCAVIITKRRKVSE